MTGATVLNGLGDLVFVLDRDQRIVATYGRWVQTRRVKASDYAGRTIGDEWPREAAQLHLEMNARALAGEVVVYESESAAPGSRRRMITVIAPLYAEEGNAVHGTVHAARELDDDAPAVSMQTVHTLGRESRGGRTTIVAAPRRKRSPHADAVMLQLSPRERQIVELLLDSARTAQIARKLEISIHTVRQHLKHILKKAGVHSQPELLDLLRGGH